MITTENGKSTFCRLAVFGADAVGIGKEFSGSIMTQNEITVDGQRISFLGNDEGFLPQRRTLVFIHGSGGTHGDWNEQIIALQKDFNIAALDLPGHGCSSGRGEHDVFAYARIVGKFLQRAGIAKPVLIGHSLGAAICLGLAIKSSELIAAIVPVGGGVRMPVNQFILDGLKNDPPTTIATIAKLSVTNANRERFAGHIAATISRTDAQTIHDDFTACNHLDLTGEIARIRIPTLVVCGAQDKMAPPAMSGRLRDNIPGAQLSLISEAGHFAMLENPLEFNAVITGFVNSLPI
jgi:pimeloyl-ACP methyl ester carboxylesterase